MRDSMAVLLSLGSDVNARNKSGSTPLHHAVSVFWLEGCRLLLERGADVQAADHEGNTVLHKVRDEQICRLLLQAGASPSAINRRGMIPLFEAVVADNRMVASEMLSLGGANPNLRPSFPDSSSNSSGGKSGFQNSSLNMAVRLGHFEMSVLLVMAGADPNSVEDESGLAMCSTMEAAQYRHLFALLLAAGGKPPFSRLDFGFEAQAQAQAQVQAMAPAKGLAARSRSFCLLQRLLEKQLGSGFTPFLTTVDVMRLRCASTAMRAAPQSSLNFPRRSLYRVHRHCDDLALTRLLSALPHLSSLRLAGCARISDLTAVRLSQSPQMRSGLSHLNLFNCHLLTDHGFAQLGHCVHLRYLNVGWCVNISDRGVRAFVDTLLSRTEEGEREGEGGGRRLQLLTLILAKCDSLSDSSLPALCSLASLQELHLSWCPYISGDGLLEHMRKLPELTYLYVTNCNGIDLAAKVQLGKELPYLRIDNLACTIDERMQYSSYLIR